MKKREFRNLRQGGRTVGQYVEDFSKLARYAPDDVATDAAKQEKFLEGLNDEMSMQLMVATFNNVVYGNLRLNLDIVHVTSPYKMDT